MTRRPAGLDEFVHFAAGDRPAVMMVPREWMHELMQYVTWLEEQMADEIGVGMSDKSQRG